MSISFEKYRKEIEAAWKDVLDDKSATDWALFGYEGQTNTLKLVGTGEGGMEELSEDLNSGKILYAFVRIEDHKKRLIKFLLINWQGEGAPVLRKGTCANHINDVAKLLSGAHLTINARNEDDIDLERLLRKLSNVSSAYIARDHCTLNRDQKTSIPTNHNRVIPIKELNPSVMQNFWKKEEEEEKIRLEAEKDLKRTEKHRLEKQQRAREEKEYLERGNKLQLPNKLQPAHIPIKTSPQPLSSERAFGNIFGSNLTHIELMRQERKREAKELIGSRVGAAKALFSKHTADGLIESKFNAAPPAKPVRNSITQHINIFNQNQSNKKIPIAKSQDELLPNSIIFADEKQGEPSMSNKEENKINFKESHLEPVKPEITAVVNNEEELHNIDDYPLEIDSEQFSTIKRSPHSKSSCLQSPDGNSSSNNTDEEQLLRTKVSVTVQQSQSQTVTNKNSLLGERSDISDLVNEDDIIYHNALGELGLKARALYDYQAADESEITFDPGDVITHIDQIDEGWWQGLGPDGTYGLFPANYVEIIK